MNLENLMSNQGLWMSFLFIIFSIIFLLFLFKKIKVKVYNATICKIENCYKISQSFISATMSPAYSHLDEEENESTSPFISFFEPSKEYIEDVRAVSIRGQKVEVNFKRTGKKIEDMYIIGNKIRVTYIYFFGKKILLA